MFSRILVASDLSDASDRVVEQAAVLRAVGAREAVLVHFLEPPGWHVPSQGDAKTTAEGLLERQRQRLAAAGFEVSLHVTGGLPELEINRSAVQMGVKLIVIGSHGQNYLTELVLGGTASAVLHQASLPVLLIRLAGAVSDESERSGQGLFRHTAVQDNRGIVDRRAFRG